MLATKLYKNVKERKNQEILKKKRNKAIKFTTITALGIGATVGATMIYKKAKSKYDEEYEDYMYNLENEDNNYEQEEENELQEKILEFNSNRLSYENESHPTVEELNKFVDNVEEQNDLDNKK
ncbi:hypothetical protein [Paraclostridium sordellii]|uniref:Uncharacterized protein n=1 Tax=Paraclostridium sordellii TaxID=1505 RepID=A0ABM9RQK5_PARSO|nr:hypothetical protein [Paeniclostridium sordellii]MCQ4697189.1 hypothetical protein [Paeniclostridium sordellii]MDU4413789.1 hypothetical protein [Paeniclostridium sordellii]MRZ30552.1 hypothetical protein [Paeniclostridium sordellii]MVO74451.1 hypothetical protein [Paeniclostridium sordellii]CEJ74068.1 uncharacterised protein [[Clostridium] sordellii] [Paeniclostridium sordellii]